MVGGIFSLVYFEKQIKGVVKEIDVLLLFIIEVVKFFVWKVDREKWRVFFLLLDVKLVFYFKV